VLTHIRSRRTRAVTYTSNLGIVRSLLGDPQVVGERVAEEAEFHRHTPVRLDRPHLIVRPQLKHSEEQHPLALPELDRPACAYGSERAEDPVCGLALGQYPRLDVLVVKPFLEALSYFLTDGDVAGIEPDRDAVETFRHGREAT
jgi:hypothetical protein